MFCPAAFLLTPVLSKKNQGVTQEQGMPWADRKYQALKGGYFSCYTKEKFKIKFWQLQTCTCKWGADSELNTVKKCKIKYAWFI